MFVGHRLCQLSIEHLLLDCTAVRNHKSRILQSGFGFFYGHIQISVWNVDALDLPVESEYRISVKRELRRVEAHRFQIRSCKAETLESFFFMFRFYSCSSAVDTLNRM